MKRRNAAERIEEGRRLLAQKAEMKLGEWLGWLKTNTDYSVATARRYCREAEAVEPEPAVDIASAWAAATMEERCRWLSEQGKMFDAPRQRVRKQDEVMARRDQAKGSYNYL